MDGIEIREEVPSRSQLIGLYKLLEWSSAKKPEMLEKAMHGSHSVLTAWSGDNLVGLANAISDGALVVYFPHLLVHPDFQGKGIGRSLMESMKKKYADFHQLCLISDSKSADFYQKCGFERVDRCPAMWIYDGEDH